MAVAYRAKTVVGLSSSSSTNITLPSGTVAGDVLVLIITWRGHVNEDYDMSDFTSIYSRSQSFSRPNVNYYYYKVGYRTATAGDVSTGYVTVSSGATYGSTSIGTLIAVSGGAGDSIQATASSVSTGTTGPTYTNAITPAYANSLILFHIQADGYLTQPTVSGYAITTNNPSWTEVADATSSSDEGQTDATAWALRPEVTSTGNYSATLSSSHKSVGILIVIPPILDVTVSPTVLTTTSSIPAPTVSGSAPFSVSTVTASFSAPTPTVSTPTSQWTNQSKS